tara:strand:+ start:11587 stop:12576 length:990 start_codon:yes stop_codon:yes gene_type:complete
MKTNTQIYSIIRLLVAVVVVVSLASCGTSQYTPYEDNDGIYNSSSQSTEAQVSESEKENSSYYKQYFQAKASTYANAPEDDVIFTDVEGYTSTETYIADDGTIYEEEVPYSEAYGPWGDESSVTVNIYSNPGYGYWHRPLWWYGSGWGLSYWNYGWAGYYGPAWGWHSPFYWNNWYGWSHPYYGYAGHYNPYYGGYSNYVAYNRGRRNTDSYRPGRTTGRSNATTRSNRSYSRSEINRRINNARSQQDARRSDGRNRTNTYSRSRTNTNRNSNMSRQNTRRSSTPRNISRPTTTNRSSGTINRGGSSVRSSGTRSGGSSRSGGGRGGRG